MLCISRAVAAPMRPKPTLTGITACNWVSAPLVTMNDIGLGTDHLGQVQGKLGHCHVDE
jgi:hypothetical protein